MAAGTPRRLSGVGTRTMLLAQITDTHIGFAGGGADEPNRRRLDQLVAHIARLDRAPDALLVSGDLVDKGDAASYRALRQALEPLAMPIHFCLGNHDDRAAFRAMFPETEADEDGFVQYAVDLGRLRLLVLDTLEEGRHGGSFCARRAAWLSARLAEDRTRPTLIMLHHPPFETGIGWMTTHDDAPWVARLRGAIAGAENIVGMVAGHIHRPMVTGFGGAPFAVCPSAAPQLALTLAPVDPSRPDDRALIVDTPPALALHWWNGRSLVTHFADADVPAVLARYDEKLRMMVRGIMAERPA
ncbi:Calcineurin-like phosphoesterase [Sphingomonas jatrophae]|uniref:Calcineurin-like phosphoesterase n=2 Tax=Sphingomonas jatrophae TaxID=1166337 RepID=A0A1I6JN51_9SPHN|nr:Calcineurin-like phosphoesterase [Sphingomonas jatrophae]